MRWQLRLVVGVIASGLGACAAGSLDEPDGGSFGGEDGARRGDAGRGSGDAQVSADSSSTDAGRDDERDGGPPPDCSPAGSGWLPLGEERVAQSTLVDLAVLADGRVALSYLDGDPVRPHVALYSGEEWTVLPTPFDGVEGRFLLSQLSGREGLHLLAGVEGDDGQDRPIVARWTTEGSWETLGAPFGEGNAHTSSGDILGDGDEPLVAWTVRTGSDARRLAIYRYRDGEWDAMGEPLGTGTGTGIFYPYLSGGGDPWVTFSERNQLYAYELVGEGWEGGLVSLPEGNRFSPRITVDPSGTVDLAYADSSADVFTATFLLRRDGGGDWDPLISDLSTEGGSTPAVPIDLRTDPEGRSVLLFRESTEEGGVTEPHVYREAEPGVFAELLPAIAEPTMTSMSVAALELDECGFPVVAVSYRIDSVNTLRVFRFEN